MLASPEAASHFEHNALVALYRTFASLAASTASVKRGNFTMMAAENWPARSRADLLLVPWRIGGLG
ncbi:K(+)/H(+) antiporter, partial [Rhodotorula sphaerocarpa]